LQKSKTYFNLHTTFDTDPLHLDTTKIGETWITKKPTEDGEVTSVEVFNKDGEFIVQFFGKRKPGNPELQEWKDLVAGL
ncbi:ChuX/HutX family heme-like substrate-binding protein, partial [Epilithonimonas vandammei]|uniref:ChuX/HutX family heme-like substrate-binding protein n=1 Tax=Epilithonimonas vandammei TaxID=2487072 RepID=UPI00289C130F